VEIIAILKSEKKDVKEVQLQFEVFLEEGGE